MSLMIAVANDHVGHMKLVMSRSGFVVFDSRAKLPKEPTKADFASALRIMADRIESAPFKEKFGMTASNPVR